MRRGIVSSGWRFLYLNCEILRTDEALFTSGGKNQAGKQSIIVFQDDTDAVIVTENMRCSQWSHWSCLSLPPQMSTSPAPFCTQLISTQQICKWHKGVASCLCHADWRRFLFIIKGNVCFQIPCRKALGVRFILEFARFWFIKHIVRGGTYDGMNFLMWNLNYFTFRGVRHKKK